MNDKLRIALEGIDTHQWSSESEVGMVIASLIRLGNYHNILESGVFKGRTSCYMIDSLPDSGYYTGIDPYDCRCDSVKEFMSNYRFILGSSLDELSKLEKDSFDLIFIDSVHEYDFLSKEFPLCENLIKKNGIIVLHDSNLPDIQRWIRNLRVLGRYEIITLNTHDEWGYNRGVCLVKCLK